MVWTAGEMANEIAKSTPPSTNEFVGRGGWTGGGLAVVALVTIVLVLIALYLASPNVNPH